jgi:hypothetical protein
MNQSYDERTSRESGIEKNSLVDDFFYSIKQSKALLYQGLIGNFLK